MTGRAGKTRNIWLVWLVWPLITLGIYHLVWWYMINREARDFDEKIDVNPVMSLLAILIGWIIIVPPFVSVYRTGERIAQMQEDAGMERSCNGWIGLVLCFFASLHSLYYQYELNRIWAWLGNPQEGSLVALPVAASVTGAPSPAAPAAEPQAAQPDGAPATEPQATRSGGASGVRPSEESSNDRPDGGASPAGS